MSNFGEVRSPSLEGTDHDFGDSLEIIWVSVFLSLVVAPVAFQAESLPSCSSLADRQDSFCSPVNVTSPSVRGTGLTAYLDGLVLQQVVR